MQKQNAAFTVDLHDFTNQGNTGDFTPSNVLDVFKGVAPKIATLMSVIRKNFNMYPSYLVTGLRTASLLRSLQDMAANMPNMRGEIGFSGSTAQFLKLKVLESMAIGDDRMYLTTKAPDNSLEKSSIVDFIFQPMYTVKETTNGNTKQFIRSRTLIDVSRTDGMGFLTINNLEKYLG